MPDARAPATRSREWWTGPPTLASTALDEELVALCREHVVAYTVPVAFRHVDALPRTEVGKVCRGDLALRLASGT
ncbi:hypothetical protein [Cryptosporangium sp. NPDC048952]|uniref:hypothetical protein n=1 Tax=Cryptosporangium sp. NPDC048952 TaxID=3363961 RepID=UPI00371B9591